MTNKFFVFLMLIFVTHRSNAQHPEPSVKKVHIESGSISGYYNNRTGIYAYKGVPFAAPPVGDLRWKAPQPVVPWKGVKECIAFGPSPIQAKPVSFLMIGPEFVVPLQPLSEDCLYLNVWTAAKSPVDKRPVLVWIYGGGFQTGGSAASGYSGEALAGQGIVFVSFNYRLGVFGFLSHPDLTAESPHHSSGNYALLDMIAALNWVKKNIAAFGGDPGRITIAGQSAGSASVNCLLASPLARDLFQGAIGESGSLVLENPILHMSSLTNAEKDGVRIAGKFNAPDLKSLRAISAEEIQKNVGGFFAPIVDGYIMPESVSDIYKKNKQTHVPLLTGWNGDEGFIFGISSKEDFARQAQTFSTDSNLFHKYFPSTSDSESIASQISLAVDKTIAISQYQWALKQNNENPKTFLYVFTRRPPAEGDKKRFGAYHTAEIGYFFHNLDSIHRAWEPVDRILEKEMSASWVQFVKTGDPNLPGLYPVWDSFSNDHPQTRYFGDSSRSGPLLNKEALDFLYVHYPAK